MVGQCTREELDRVGEEVAICVIRQQDMVMEVEKIFRRDIYIEEAMCLMLENIKDKCVQRWSQCYQDRQVGCSSYSSKTVPPTQVSQLLGLHLDNILPAWETC